MSSQILVAGTAGFSGSHICAHLFRQGYHVVKLDDLSGGFHDQIPGGVDSPYAPSCPKTANILKIGWQLWHGHSLGNRNCFRPIKKD